ncbi:MAG: TlyA family RNA methyltransferase [Nitratireductor sp.]|jgi:23S rRNA (cytidine1920-2'-O)/16S rRNA (cytidine1409-2'-O)-methyltransferase|nr:TlyA family RNA methyltransferase [Nitratireductor sp.]
MKTRLDQALVDRGLYASRSRARDAVLRGTVTVNGQPAAKPASHVGSGDIIAVEDKAKAYVSRAALKLKAGLDATGFDPAGRTALDIGASTGGFTQVLLEAGAAHVIAIDVGHGQIDAGLAGDRRVTNIEGLNARELTAEAVGGAKIGFVVTDVSFISLTLALPPALALAMPGAQGIFLVKPQFEVGREHVNKAGIVLDAALAEATALRLRDWLDEQPGWRAVHLIPSPIEGGEGNREFLLAGVKDR